MRHHAQAALLLITVMRPVAVPPTALLHRVEQASLRLGRETRSARSWPDGAAGNARLHSDTILTADTGSASRPTSPGPLAADIQLTCPARDSAFDNDPELQRAILGGLDDLWRHANPYDPRTAQRREQAGWIFRDPLTGHWEHWMNPLGAVNACKSDAGLGPMGIPPDAFWGPIHVHPFALDAQTPSTTCRGQEVGHYVGGPSPADVRYLRHESANNPHLRGVVMDADNIYVYQANGSYETYPWSRSATAC